MIEQQKIARKLIGVSFALAVSCAPFEAGGAQGDPPYEAKIERLSEILGSVHYLRNLCGDATNVWREKMDALLTAENPVAERKARLVARFNRGYRSFASVYEKCTPAATLALTRYTQEGDGITREIVQRYGN